MRRRDKLSDVKALSKPFLGSRTATFREAFPEIVSMRLEVDLDLSGTNVDKWNAHHVYTLESPPPIALDCPNQLCTRGGLDIEQILRNIVAGRQTEFNCGEGCRGYEGSPKGRVKYRECDNYYRVKGSITYKD